MLLWGEIAIINSGDLCAVNWIRILSHNVATKLASFMADVAAELLEVKAYTCIIAVKSFAGFNTMEERSSYELNSGASRLADCTRFMITFIATEVVGFRASINRRTEECLASHLASASSMVESGRLSMAGTIPLIMTVAGQSADCTVDRILAGTSRQSRKKREHDARRSRTRKTEHEGL